jgi:hypothetical protein
VYCDFALLPLNLRLNAISEYVKNRREPAVGNVYNKQQPQYSVAASHHALRLLTASAVNMCVLIIRLRLYA